MANTETGEMEWHAADGTVISESDWQDQQAAVLAAEAAAEAEAAAAMPTGSHAPLDDVAQAPEGFPIKGNADSMKYHTPDGRWFASAVAEIWFDTVESAEAAGYTEAGATETEDESTGEDAAAAAEDAAAAAESTTETDGEPAAGDGDDEREAGADD